MLESGRDFCPEKLASGKDDLGLWFRGLLQVIARSQKMLICAGRTTGLGPYNRYKGCGGTKNIRNYSACS